MDMQDKIDLSQKVGSAIKTMQKDSDSWVDLATLGPIFNSSGIIYKSYGFQKLKHFLCEFQDIVVMREEQPNKDNPPVVYVRLRKAEDNNNFAQQDYLECSGKDSPKPPYDNNKSPLYALGYIADPQKAVDFFSTLYGLNQETLESNIKDSYDHGDIIYFEYNESWDLIKSQNYSKSKTIVFAVNTHAIDDKGKKIYAQYNRFSESSETYSGVYFRNEYQIKNQINSYRIGRLSFKNFTEANEFIKNLHKTLLPGEKWKYATPSKTTPRRKTEYEILESYLSIISDVLVRQNSDEKSLNYEKIRFSKNKEYALFNTGLLNSMAMDIILIGEIYPKNSTDDSSIILSNPFILENGKTGLIGNGFKPDDGKVDMVSFFKNISQIVYDPSLEVDLTDAENVRHCIEDGIKRNRFPLECKKKYENNELEDLTDMFQKAIHRAERIARRNYKYVIPQYYRVKDSTAEYDVQFLMPIYMTAKYDESPDCALVLSINETETNEKYYKPETVLELSWAYNNARVICKPDNTWLTPENINDVEEPNFNEENFEW